MGSKARSVSIGAIAAATARLLEFPAGVPVVALLTGIVLAVRGTDLVVTVGAMVLGMIAGGVTAMVFWFVGMSFSAEQSGYGRAMGFSDSDEPSVGYVIVGWLSGWVPQVVAIGATLISAAVLADVDRSIVEVGLLVVGMAIGIGAGIAAVGRRAYAVRRHVDEAAQQIDWLQERDAAASRDPEFAEQLRAEGWRVDGPYDQMRAAYFRAWEAVKAARRASGQPIWSNPGAPLEQRRDDTDPDP